ncbi:MAG: glycoside hydrolase family 20 zincin-like fold domain-containing protein, partial [Bacteroidales bacterium]|nr:glycoside hydrolase family 20 zincin-like fold domain-containing protein [Bacteroidales bacterium]
MKNCFYLCGAMLACVVLVSCSQTTVSVIPQPQSVSLRCGHFNCIGARVVVDAALEGSAAAAYIATFREELAAVNPEGRRPGKIRFQLDTTMADEAYTLDVRTRGVCIKASGLNGFVYGIQTLKQLMPEQIWSGEYKAHTPWKIRNMHISDSPRFG